jgi:hypothetical protein
MWSRWQLELKVGLGRFAIGCCGWEYTDGRASVNEKSEVIGVVVHVKKTTSS